MGFESLFPSPVTRFVDIAREGRSDLTALFDEQVALWHDNAATEPLHEWLGLTEGEYAAIVEHPGSLHEILKL